MQKPFNVKNFIKSETRLTSLMVPRDLSLGGTKPKKLYKPNVNVIRNKNKPKEIIHKIQQQKRSARVQNNRHNNSQRFVQSAGVFSEGTTEIRRPKIHSDRCVLNGERDGSSMIIPKVFKNAWNIDVKEESAVIDELLLDEDDDASVEGEYGPIVLPLKCNKEGFMDRFKVKPDDEVKIKLETDTKPNVKLINGFLKNKETNIENDLDYQLPTCFTENKLYDDDNPSMSLMKIPDSLPGKGFDKETDKPVDYDLSQMLEGQIGKILVRKSGKVEVSIGQTQYILDTVQSNPFKEEVMYIPENLKTEFSPEITSLGNIDESYILSPSWKNLFVQKDLKKSKKKRFN